MTRTWPELHYDDWADTAATLHMWTQIVGKIRMEATPSINHWWHVTLYVTSRGLGTSLIPHPERAFEIDFDFIDHLLRIRTADGASRDFPLTSMTVAEFHDRVMAALDALGVPVAINLLPNEVPDPIPFDSDSVHRSYDPDAVSRFWQVLVHATRVFTAFRSDFLGKVSPVHFFWGAMDMALTRFSGRVAPPHGPVPYTPLRVVREAYSHEVSSAGFWAGGPGIAPMFYAYAYPEPQGFADAKVEPSEAFYSRDMGEFVLPYEAVRSSADPDAALSAFLRSTYEAGATLANWDRASLEREPESDT